jgi:hypothetical protein
LIHPLKKKLSGCNITWGSDDQTPTGPKNNCSVSYTLSMKSGKEHYLLKHLILAYIKGYEVHIPKQEKISISACVEIHLI